MKIKKTDLLKLNESLKKWVKLTEGFDFEKYRDSTDEWRHGLTWGELKKLMKQLKASDDTKITCGWRGDVPYGGKPKELNNYSLFGCDEERDEDLFKVHPEEICLLYH